MACATCPTARTESHEASVHRPRSLSDTGRERGLRLRQPDFVHESADDCITGQSQLDEGCGRPQSQRNFHPNSFERHADRLMGPKVPNESTKGTRAARTSSAKNDAAADRTVRFWRDRRFVESGDPTVLLVPRENSKHSARASAVLGHLRWTSSIRTEPRLRPAPRDGPGGSRAHLSGAPQLRTGMRPPVTRSRLRLSSHRFSAVHQRVRPAVSIDPRSLRWRLRRPVGGGR